jgi:SAM-dependent methyltransferase
MDIARRLRRHVVSQFHRPRGALGRVAGLVLARRPSNRRRNLWTVDRLEIEPHHRVLELGYGPGVAVEACARRARRGEVVGVDHSEVMQRVATRRNARAAAEGRVRLLVAGFDALPGLDLGGPFDRILAVNSVTFADDPAAVIAGLAGRLRPGGRLAITFQSRRPGARDADSARGGEELAAALRAAGLADVRIETLALPGASAVCALGRRDGAPGTP